MKHRLHCLSVLGHGDIARKQKVAAGSDETQLPLLMREDTAGMESNYIASTEPSLQPYLSTVPQLMH